MAGGTKITCVFMSGKTGCPSILPKVVFENPLTNVSLEYLDEFIMETCRGEWLHLADCLLSVLLLLINPWPLALLFGALPCIGNLPFAVIQRYNRFRLLQLRKKLLHDMQRAGTRQTASVVA